MPKIIREPYNQDKSEEQVYNYHKTGNATIPQVNPNKTGYSEAYAEGWARIFGSKEEAEKESSDSEE